MPSVSVLPSIFPTLPSGLFSALGKDIGMPSAVVLRSVVSYVLGKQLFCRMPNEMHAAKLLALGKSTLSGSETSLHPKTPILPSWLRHGSSRRRSAEKSPTLGEIQHNRGGGDLAATALGRRCVTFGRSSGRHRR